MKGREGKGRGGKGMGREGKGRNGTERKVNCVKRGWVKGVKDERGRFKVDKREELKVEKGKG